MKKSTSRVLPFVFCVFFVLFSAACAGNPSAYKQNQDRLTADPALTSGTLENGMSYYLLKNGEPENRVSIRLVVKAGSLMEDDDQQGLAHFVEHMAFDGSDNFGPDELVNYFESIGMEFGPEVNAYTTFDKTVYMLEIPADDSDALETALLVLRDWACGLSFAEEQIQKERSVITEEWRLRRGYSARRSDEFIGFTLKDSLYSERKPIGDMEIISSAPRERIVDFYDKWYRPDLMAVIVVGDIDVDLVEQSLRARLSEIPAAGDPLPQAPDTAIPWQKTPALGLYRDAEAPYTFVYIFNRVNCEPILNEALLQENLNSYIAFSILQNRLDILERKNGSPIVGAGAGSLFSIGNTDFVGISFIPAENNFTQGTIAVFEEAARLKKYGASQSDFELVKADIAASAEYDWNNKNKRSSDSLASDLIQYIVDGDVFLSPEDEYRLISDALEKTSLKTVNGVIKSWFDGNTFGKMMCVFAPEGENAADIPSYDEIFDLWRGWRPSASLGANEGTDLTRPLFDAAVNDDVPKLKSAEDISLPTDSGIKRLSLPNGASVAYLSTEYKTDQILFSAFSMGGSSLADDNDYPSAVIADEYVLSSGLNGFSPIELRQKTSGKNVSVSPQIDEISVGLTGSSSVKDLETLFQLINLYFTAPNFTEDGWDYLVKNARAESSARLSQPRTMFSSMLMEMLHPDNLRRESILQEKFISQFDSRRAEELYRSYFSDASYFTFVFVGSIDEERLRELSLRYLGTLPSQSDSPREKRAVWRGSPFPRGISERTLSMGVERQSRVCMVFGGEPRGIPYEKELFDRFVMLLDIKMREEIRERLGGSYNAGAYGAMIFDPGNSYKIYIDFGCEPGKEKALSEAVIDIINDLRENPVDESYIVKLKENWKRSRETQLKTNEFWLYGLVSALKEKTPLDDIDLIDEVEPYIAAEYMRSLANQYLDPANYVKAVLEPED